MPEVRAWLCRLHAVDTLVLLGSNGGGPVGLRSDRAGVSFHRIRAPSARRLIVCALDQIPFRLQQLGYSDVSSKTGWLVSMSLLA